MKYETLMYTLEEKQKELERSLRELEREKRLLEALCVDYTSVHYCNLTMDTIQTMKSEAYASVKKNLESTKREEELYSYSNRIQFYYDHYIEKESAPDFVERLRAENLMQELSGKERVVFHFRAKENRTGQQHFEVQVARVPSAEGFEVVMGYRYIDDIIEAQERQQAKLQKALEKVQLNNEIISSISTIYQNIYRMDLEKEIYEEVSAGDEYHQLTGKRGNIEEMFERLRKHVIAEEHLEAVKKFQDIKTLPERLAKKETISIECKSTNGKWYLARFIVKKRNEMNKVTHVLYLVIEIDDQKQQELEYQAKLQATAEEAKRANMAKTEFLRRMSHDIRTPINGIRGMLQVSEYFPSDTEKLSEYRKKMWDSSEYLLNLVNSVLDMNKLESGNITLQEAPFDFRDVLRDLDNLIGTQAAQKKITLLYGNHEVTHNYLIGCALYVRQIFMNIGNNAVKYTDAGGTIEVSCVEKPIDEDTSHFCFSVKDTGVGMSEAFQEHIYEAFSQEGDSMNADQVGSGLGMSICKQLVELMGGKISFQSEQGIGTTFYVELPLKINHNVVHQEKDETQRNLNGKKILLVEDNELNAEITKSILEQAGMIVDTVENGKEAVERFYNTEEGTYALILMDIMMPVMNGYEAAKAIRQAERPDGKTIPIIALSANAFHDDVKESIEAGMNRHLEKPIDEKKLLLAIQDVL